MKQKLALITLGFLLTSCVNSESRELTLEVEPSNEQALIETSEDVSSNPSLTQSAEEDCLKRDEAWYISEVEEGYGYQWRYVENHELALDETYGMIFSRCIDPSETKVFAAFKEGEGMWYFDLTGEKMLKIYSFDNGPDYFEEGLSRYLEGDKIGYIDEDLNVVIPAQFDGAFPFKNGVAKVCVGCERSRVDGPSALEGGKWGLVDKEGDVIWDA